MMASMETKRAKIGIVVIKAINNRNDRQYLADIKRYKKELIQAIGNHNNRHMEICRAEIKQRRMLLQKFREQVYVFEIFIKKYRRKIQIEMNFDHSKGRKEFKKFIEAAVNHAMKLIRIQLKLTPMPVIFGKKWAYLKYGSKERGYVFAEEGSILKSHVQKNMKLLIEGKTPAMPRKYVGIELEFCAPIKEEQFALKLFQNGIHKFAQLKHDGSLRPVDKETGFELAILLEENNYKKSLKNITQLLTEVKAVAKDRRCGLHVHLDMRRRDKDLVYNNLVACQYALLSIVDPNRYNNEFCRVVTGRKFPTEFTGDRAERYKTINAAAYYKYKTLEVRMHEGSVSFDEISHWVDLLIKIANYSKRLKDNVTKLPILHNRMKLKKTLYNYAIERSCSFAIQNNQLVLNIRQDAADLMVRPPPRRQVQARGNQVNRAGEFEQVVRDMGLQHPFDLGIEVAPPRVENPFRHLLERERAAQEQQAVVQPAVAVDAQPPQAGGFINEVNAVNWQGPGDNELMNIFNEPPPMPEENLDMDDNMGDDHGDED